MIPYPNLCSFVVGIVLPEFLVPVNRDLGNFTDIILIIVQEAVPKVFPGNELNIGKAGVLEHCPGILTGLAVQIAGRKRNPDPILVTDSGRSDQDDNHHDSNPGQQDLPMACGGGSDTGSSVRPA